jgi:hypothetical protein
MVARKWISQWSAKFRGVDYMVLQVGDVCMAKIEPRSLIGTWRRFGPVGPAYEIVAIGDLTRDGTDRVVKIRLAETGEQVDYTLNRAVDDEIVAQTAY